MKTGTNEKSFDAMKWLRETRARIYEETKDMTFEERRRWSEERLSRNPSASDCWNSMRKPQLWTNPRNANDHDAVDQRGVLQR